MNKHTNEAPGNNSAESKPANENFSEQKGKENPKEDMKKESLGADYWDRIANDVASGYEAASDKDDILNTDQEADDHSRGD